MRTKNYARSKHLSKAGVKLGSSHLRGEIPRCEVKFGISVPLVVVYASSVSKILERTISPVSKYQGSKLGQHLLSSLSAVGMAETVVC